ncbi:hypothetical protein LAZ67_16002821 [Cordylochernes scorpioides]|uniref:Transposase n=1 Tax=Cordylochernes scorpioides TaxID=51811 RepID=A0ABY6LDK2_9ARAC|nr:hypothetical protein LAZ67_16002821 [Cordylochernes scorpioides]
MDIAIGKIKKEGKWLPHELSEKNKENQRMISEILLESLHRNVTGDEKLAVFGQFEAQEIMGKPRTADNFDRQTQYPRNNVLLCIWWDQHGILYYELLQPVVTSHHYQQLTQLRQEIAVKRPEWAQRHGKLMLLHDNAAEEDNARPHLSQSVKETLKYFKWKVLPHPPYSPDIAPSDFQLFLSIAQDWLTSTSRIAKLKIRLMNGLSRNQNFFFNDGIHKLYKLCANVTMCRRSKRCVARSHHIPQAWRLRTLQRTRLVAEHHVVAKLAAERIIVDCGSAIGYRCILPSEEFSVH